MGVPLASVLREQSPWVSGRKNDSNKKRKLKITQILSIGLPEKQWRTEMYLKEWIAGTEKERVAALPEG